MANKVTGIRKAVMGDAQDIQRLVNEHAGKGLMLALSLSEIYEHVRDFIVWEKGGRVVGACALHVIWENLAEIRSLAVEEGFQRHGKGSKLVEACLREARGMGIGRVFALTYQNAFFTRLGFRRVEKSELPHKVWNDCLKCPKFPGCDEEAFLVDLEGDGDG
jgi:amino-acid N-acetyltransferase